VAETKQRIRLHFLAHLRLNLFLGSAKRLSHSLSQKSEVTHWAVVAIRRRLVTRMKVYTSATPWCRSWHSSGDEVAVVEEVVFRHK